jgi:N-methylhydantoinase A
MAIPATQEGDFAVAVDIGGTFTDIALHDRATGRTWRAKTPSIPSDPSEAFMAGLRLVLEASGASVGALRHVLHGTTIATNMILEEKGARTALITSAGFRHVLAIGRQDIPRRANLYAWVKPRRPVPTSRVIEVIERIGTGGTVLQALDEASVEEAAATCRRLDVQAVAICLLHAFANPTHEMRVAEILRAALPGVAITTSSDVLPVVREYERSLATVLNAVVMPGVATYVSRLQERLATEGVEAPLLLMQSNGGVAGAAVIRRVPALTALSGPAAGVVGAKAAASACGIDNLIAVDIGGTSADICLLNQGRIGLTQHGHIGEWPLPLPMVDMVTIGAGGGSIAKVTGGTMSVGPQSAGAMPGPAAYGRGGTAATVTDAHVVLGHLPEQLLSGRMALNGAASREAVHRTVAEPLGLSVEAAARGILTIIDNNMVGAVRVVSVERGHDPRDFTLVPFGGAGPLHGCSLASLLGISRIMIPPAPGVLCADGLLAADLKAEFSRTLPKAGSLDAASAESLFADLTQQAEDWFAMEGLVQDARSLSLVALMRYHGQGSEIAVPWTRTGRGGFELAFAAAHEALYGFTLDTGVEVVTLRVEAVGRLPRPPHERVPMGRGAVASSSRRVYLAEGWVELPVLEREALGAGDSFAGPAIVTQLDATTVVLPRWQASVHASGAILLTAE